MAEPGAQAPIIIKRKKVSGGDGHHGGAWKVAYADFVTAMMAFFMLMWLLNATTEQQRKGIADYFTPTVSISRVSGGGDGAFGGDSVFSEANSARSGTGSSGEQAPWLRVQEAANGSAEKSDQERLATEIDEALKGTGGESALLENQLRHIVTKVTDEGVSIEIFSIKDAPLFSVNDTATPILSGIVTKLSGIISNVDNHLAIVGHVRARPLVAAQGNMWKSSAARGVVAANLLRKTGVENARIRRVVGKADTEIATPDPLSVRNDRIEIILLR